MDEMQSIQNLFGHFLKSRHIEIVLFLNLSIVFGILIEVVSEQLCDNKEMLFVVKVIKDFE